MPILLEYRRHLACPTVFCDHCGERIRDGSRANYIWRGYDRTTGTLVTHAPILYVHWDCERAFQDAHPGEYYAWGHLDVFPTMIATNLNLRKRAVQKSLQFVRWINSWRFV